MTKLTLTEQEELFAKDCKLINLRYEYTHYIGTEKWAVVTELTEKELREKYPDIIRRYTPFLLSPFGQTKNADSREMRGFPNDLRYLNEQTVFTPTGQKQ